MNENNTSKGRLIAGAILVVLGGIFLLNEFDFFYFDFSDFIFRWQTILIVIGIIILANSPKNISGYILILIGGTSIASDYYDISFWNVASDYWPVLLILIGVYIIFKRESPKTKSAGSCCGHNGKYNESATDFVDINSIFYGNKVIVTSNNFRGGRLTAIFGGTELNLSQCKLAQGINILDTFTLFGGTELLIPRDWNVSVKVVSIFGGIDDKRYSIPEAEKTGGLLEIKGLTLFGGTEIKYY